MIIFRFILCSIICFVLQLQVLSADETVQQSLADNPPSKKILKVGFIMGGSISDMGWNQAHNEGRFYLEKAMKGKIQTTYAEKIPENAEAARIMEKMIAQGTKIIFLTTYGYLDPALNVAAHHPDVIFMQINRTNNPVKENIGNYYLAFHEPMYVAGIVAGRKTRSNNIGFIIGHPVPNVFVTMNAFALGAQSVNPKVRVHAVSINSWSDPIAEVEATNGLIERGADVIVSHLDSSLTVCLTAARKGAYSVGEHMDLNKQVPVSWLTGQAWNCGPLYTRFVQSVIDNTWKPGPSYYGLKDNCVKLCGFGQSVPQNIRNEALMTLQKIKTGNVVIFRGPIKDSRGKLRVPAGQVISDQSLATMDWAASGIDCAFSKK